MSLALAYSRSLAAAGSAGLQVYSMAPAYHPGMEAASHQMSFGQHHPGARPADSYKPPPSHTVAMGGGASTEGKGHSRMSPTGKFLGPMSLCRYVALLPCHHVNMSLCHLTSSQSNKKTAIILIRHKNKEG